MSLGCRILAGINSRLDFAVDTGMFTPSDIAAWWAKGQVVRRSRDYSLLGKGSLQGLETIGFGSRERIYVRVYDKRKCKANSEQYIRDYLKAHGWERFPATVTRIEFEVRREKLVEMGLADWNAVFDSAALGDAVAWLTQKWFRVCAGVVTKGNQSKAKLHPMWKLIQDGFRVVFGCGVARHLVKKKEGIKRECLKNVGLGCLARLVAESGEVVETILDIPRIVASLLAEKRQWFIDRYQRARVELEKQGLLPVAIVQKELHDRENKEGPPSPQRVQEPDYGDIVEWIATGNPNWATPGLLADW